MNNDFPFTTPHGRYNIDVNHSFGRESTELVARDPILGTWRRLVVREEDLNYLETYDMSAYEFVLRRLEAEMDRQRDLVTAPLLNALIGQLLDFQSRCTAYRLLKLLGCEERVRGMSPWSFYDHYTYNEERDKACEFVAEHPEIENFAEFCIRIQLIGDKPFYNEKQFQTVHEAVTQLKLYEERLTLRTYASRTYASPIDI